MGVYPLVQAPEVVSCRAGRVSVRGSDEEDAYVVSSDLFLLCLLGRGRERRGGGAWIFSRPEEARHTLTASYSRTG